MCSLGSTLKFWAGLFSTTELQQREVERSVSHWGGITALWLLLNTRGQPKAGVIQQLITVLWFCTATLFKAQQRLQVHPNTFILSMADTDGGSAI